MYQYVFQMLYVQKNIPTHLEMLTEDLHMCKEKGVRYRLNRSNTINSKGPWSLYANAQYMFNYLKYLMLHFLFISL